jgi:phage/plasmid-like protein (TIGR03299 family)
MSHELDMTTGKAAMAYTGETPWHKLGERLERGASIEQWAKAAGIEWEAIKIPGYMKLDDQFVEVPNHFHLIRNDTAAILGHFTDSYKPVQPSEILGFFRDHVLSDPRFSIETAGALREGRLIFALARFEEDLEVAGDKHGVYIGLATSYDGTLSTTAQGTCIRWVCNNTVTAGMLDKSAVIKIRHNQLFTTPRQEQAVAELTEALQATQIYKKVGDTLALRKLNNDQIGDFFKYCLDIPLDMPREEISTRKYNQFEALLLSLQKEYDAGADKNTAWAALNAVTRYIDHERTARVTGTDSAMRNRVYSANFGSGATIKTKAIAALVDGTSTLPRG